MGIKNEIGLVVGDRVKVISSLGGKSLTGRLGTVVIVRLKNQKSNSPFGGFTIGVEMDKPFAGGHSCSGFPPNFPIFKSGHCRWGSHDEVKFIEHGPPIKPQTYDYHKQKM